MYVTIKTCLQGLKTFRKRFLQHVYRFILISYDIAKHSLKCYLNVFGKYVYNAMLIMFFLYRMF